MTQPTHQANVERQFLSALQERLGFKGVSDRVSGGWRDVFWGDEIGGSRDTTLKLFANSDGRMCACLHMHNSSRRLRDGKRPNSKGNVTYTQEELAISRTASLPAITSLAQEHMAKCHDAAYGALSRNRGRIAQAQAVEGMGADDKQAVSSYTTNKGILARHDGAPPVHHQASYGRDSLCVPLYQLARQGDTIRCHLLNRQSIETTGKRFLKGPATKGICFPFGLGFDPKTQTLTVTNPKRIFLGEGYATTATVHEATGQPAVVGLNTTNMVVIAGQLARMFPHAELVICADNDLLTEKKLGSNPGILAAIDAAREVQVQRALAGVPLDAQPTTHVITPLPSELEAGVKVSDFNDAWHKHYHETLNNGTSAESAREQALAFVRDAIADGLEGGAHAVDRKAWALVQGADFERMKHKAVEEQLHLFATDLNDAVGPGFAELAKGGATAPGLGVVYQQGSRAACSQTLRLNAPGAAIMAALKADANAQTLNFGEDKLNRFKSSLGANWGIECVMLHARTKEGDGRGAVWPLWIATQRDKDGNALKALPLTNSEGKHFMQRWLMSVIGQARNYTSTSTPYKKDAPDAAAFDRAAGLRALQRVCSANKVLYVSMSPQASQARDAIWETVTSVHECDADLRAAANTLAQKDVHLLRPFRLDATGITVSKTMAVFLGESAPDAAAKWFKNQGSRPYAVAGAKVYSCDASSLAAFTKHMGVDLAQPDSALETIVRVANPDYLAKILPSAANSLAAGKLTAEAFIERLASNDALLPDAPKLQLSSSQQGLLGMSAIALRRRHGLDAMPQPTPDEPLPTPQITPAPASAP